LIQSVIAACSCAATGDLEGITRLYNLGISLDQGDYDKRTPLHLASAAGHFELVKFLINVKVDLNCHDRWGATPLNDAKSDQIRDLLLSHGG
jgi:glutaminase